MKAPNLRTKRFPKPGMSKTKCHSPIRSCIACGSKREKKQLLRLVLDNDGWVVVDKSGHAPGRGAYVCKNEECWSAIQKQKILARAFRGKGRMALRADLDSEMPVEIRE